MQQQRSTLAQRRAERMQGNIYQSNDSGMARMPGSPAPRPPTAQGGSSRSMGQQNQQGYGYNERDSGQRQGQGSSGNVYGLASTFDPNEDHYQQPQRQMMPRSLAPPPVDLSDIRAFLMQPGRKWVPASLTAFCVQTEDPASRTSDSLYLTSTLQGYAHHVLHCA